LESERIERAVGTFIPSVVSLFDQQNPNLFHLQNNFEDEEESLRSIDSLVSLCATCIGSRIDQGKFEEDLNYLITHLEKIGKENLLIGLITEEGELLDDYKFIILEKKSQFTTMAEESIITSFNILQLGRFSCIRKECETNSQTTWKRLWRYCRLLAFLATLSKVNESRGYFYLC